MGIMKIHAGNNEPHTSKRLSGDSRHYRFTNPVHSLLLCTCYINLNIFLCLEQNKHSFSDDFKNHDLTFQK